MSQYDGEIPKGRDQVYYSGYVQDWTPVTLTPGEGEVSSSTSDPWFLRLVYGTNEVTVPTVRTLSGLSLVLSYTFTAEQTRLFAGHGDIQVVLEYGEGEAARPRMVHWLRLSRRAPPA